MSKRRVSYYYDPDVGSYTYGLGHPMKPHRIRMAHELISAYDMLGKMHVIRPKRSTPETMSSFHTDEYVHFLNRVTPETAEELTSHGSRFLVGDDNPPFEGVFEFCSISAGGSIDGARRIASGATDIAINWAGGLHHAKKREASGFCYINDIVLGILELLRTYPRVLYIDIDCHHGDGVEEAFYITDRVMTCSFHKYGEYFPGTGTQEDRGRGKGKGYAINVPLKDGMTDETFRSVFEPIISKIITVFQPSAIVLQCGADSLSGDKLGCFNLTMQGHAQCVQFVRKYNIPLMILGGGGYTVKNVARAWTYETACALGIEDTIDPNLPWNEYFEWFGPRYRLEVAINNMEDLNVKDGSIDKVRKVALEHLRELQGAPSVGMHDVPRESLGRHLGLGIGGVRVEEDGRDELDEKLAQHTRFIYHLQDNSSSETTSSESDYSESDESTTSKSSRRRTTRRHNHAHTSTSTTTRHGKTQTRMSVLTNQFFEIPTHEDGFAHFDRDFGSSTGVGNGPGAGNGPKSKSKRKFFQSQMEWDEKWQRVFLERRFPYGGGGGEEGNGIGLAEVMERGGRSDVGGGGEFDMSLDDGGGGDEEWGDMAVDN